MATGHYLKERCSADLEYSNALKASLQTLPHEKGKASSTTLKSGLVEVHVFQSYLSGVIREMAVEAEQELLQVQLGSVVRDYEKKATDANMSMSALSGELHTLSERSAKQFREHLVAFQQLEQQFSKGRVQSTCVWLSERKYMTAVKELLDLHKVYSSFIVQLSKEVQELELRRVLVIKSVMTEFIRRHTAIYLQDVSGVVAALEAIEPKDNCTIDKLLDEEEAQVLANLRQAGSLEDALLTWTLEIPQSTPLVLYESYCLRETAMLKQWRPAYLVLTKDGYLHSFSNPPSEVFADPTNTFVKSQARWSINSADNTLVLEIKAQGRLLGLFSSVQRFQYQFSDEGTTAAWRAALEDERTG
jgi:hypothetical protein